MRTDLLTEEDRKERLQPLLDNGWEMTDGRDQIEKKYTFSNFRIAFGWMKEITQSRVIVFLPQRNGSFTPTVF